MKPHVKKYMDALGYTPGDWMPCEVAALEASDCKGKGTAVDIHHIEARGMGGSNDANSPANLMALCRECHEYYGDKRQHTDFLQLVHRTFMLKFAK